MYNLIILVSMETNYHKVLNFNTKFGTKMYTEPSTLIFDDIKVVTRCMSLIREEVRELEDSINNKDMVETIDALADTLYVVYGMGCTFGIDMDEAVDEFHRATMDELNIEYNKDTTITNYQKVSQFVAKSHLKVYEVTTNRIFKDIDLITLCMNLIRERIMKLEKAVANKNMIKTINALTQAIYAIYYMGCRLGVDMDLAVNLVHKSNMSKLCVDEEEALKTIEFYIDAYENGDQPYDSPVFRKSDDDKYYVVYNQSTDKILKSINYHLVDLRPLVKN